MMRKEPEASPGQASPAAPPQHLEPTCVYKHTHIHIHTHTHRAGEGCGLAGELPAGPSKHPRAG